MDAWVCGRWNVPEAQPWPGTLKAQDRECLAIPQMKRQSSDTAEPQLSLGYLSLASLSDIQCPKVIAVAQEETGFFIPTLCLVPTFSSKYLSPGKDTYMHSLFPHPHISPKATTSPPTTGFPPAVNRYLQRRFLCGCTKDSSDLQAWYNYWNINLYP